MRVDTTSRIPGAMVIGDEGAALVSGANVSQANTVSAAEIESTATAVLVTVANVSQANSVSQVSSGHVVSSVGNSIRVATSSLISGAMVIGDVGLGLLGSQIPSTGDDGAGYLYNDLSLPADADKEVRGEIVTWPTHGDLVADEDSAFIYTPDLDYVGTDSFTYQLYVEGIATGSPVTVDLTIVAETQYITTGDVLQSNSVSPVVVYSGTPTQITIAGVSQVNSISESAVNQTHLITSYDSIQFNNVSQASAGHGYTTDELIYKLLTNKHELDPYLGVYRVFDDDGVTVLRQAKAWQDEIGTIPYRGHELRRIDRLM